MSDSLPFEAEPIPGYRLIERIGGGGYGEVWKATAPGGLLKAIKIVHGQIDANNGESPSQADQELRALKRVLSVRHPYLLSLERFDIVDGRLFIVMELADCNLWERFRLHRAEGQVGIPREDLIRYMLETAEVLDLMNNQYQLQHLDIKPQNLFLIHDHVKVADFGLVKDLEGMRASITGGVTPVYAAPETFDGIVTRFCDQYSLAIVYQELLTGQRPFNGASVQQLIMQHLRGTPNLSTLPPSDRIVLMRALAKTPEERFPTCAAMVKALQSGMSSSGPMNSVATAAPPSPPESTRTFSSGTPTSRGHPGLLPPPSAPMPTPATLVRLKREEFQPQPDLVAPVRLAPPEMTGNGCLMPTLIVGVGQLGVNVLCHLRANLAARFGSPDRLPTIRTLYIDTDVDTATLACQQGTDVSIPADDVILARLNRASHYLRPRRNGRSLIEGWFDPQMLYRIPRNPATMGLRCLGRLAYCDHFRTINQKFRQELDTAIHPDSIAAADRATRLGIRTNRPRCYVVAGLAGGTGGGMFLDVAYTLRHRLRLAGYTDDEVEIIGLLMVPVPEKQANRPPTLGNCYASLRELHHFSLPETAFRFSYDDRDATINDPRPPFERFMLLAPPARGRSSEWHFADLLTRELITPFGRTVDAARKAWLSSTTADSDPVVGQTFGLMRISWPRAALVEDAARQLCRRVLIRWTESLSVEVRQAVGNWVQEQWQARQLGQESLLVRLQQACADVIGTVPETLFQQLVEPFLPRGFWSRTVVDRNAAIEVLNRLESIVGTPSESTIRRQPGQFTQVIHEIGQSVIKECGPNLAQAAMKLIEEPDFRLSGAEEAIQQLRSYLDQIIEQHEPTTLELAAQAAEAHTRSHTLLSADPGRRIPGGDLAEALRLYATFRYQYLILKQLTMVYASLRNQMLDSLREISFCREKLSEITVRFSQRNKASGVPDGQLLPDGCLTIADASRRLSETISDDDIRRLDRRLQAMIEEQFSALAHVCMSSSGLIGTLETVLVQQGRDYVSQKLGSVDVASMFLNRFHTPDAAAEALAQAYEEATPALARLARGGSNTLDVLAIPPDSPLEQVARQALPGLEMLVVPGHEEIAFYREQPRLQLADLPQASTTAEDAYHALADQVPSHPPHSRNDVDDWLPLDPG